jgi:hypothetical protein
MEGKTSSVSVEILGQSAEQSRREQIGLFLDLDEREPGCWAIDSQGNEPIPTLFQSPGRSILVKLHQAIPVPDRETPLEDVFRFVERRKPEQIALRSHLDGIYQKIIIAGDGPLAFHTEINNLKMAIADQMAVLNESLFRVTYAGLNAKMKWEFDTRPTVAAATAAGFVAGVEAALAAALIGTISNIIPKIEVEAGAEMLLGARTSRPFEYVLQMHRGW